MLNMGWFGGGQTTPCSTSCIAFHLSRRVTTTADWLRGTKTWVPTPGHLHPGWGMGAGRGRAPTMSTAITPENFWKLRC